MDARVSPAGLPLIQILLRFFETFETLPLQGCFLSVTNARFDFTFPIRISDAARQGGHSVMAEHILEKRIQCGIVDIWSKDTFTKIVQNHQTRAATQTKECGLMQLSPDLAARLPRQQPDGFAAEAQCQNKQSSPPILPGLSVAHHRAAAIVDLRFFTRCGNDDRLRRRRLSSASLANESFDGIVGAGEAVAGVTRSCQMATALRPLLIPASMNSRNGSQALGMVDGGRGIGAFSAKHRIKSVVTPSSLAGFAASESVATLMAGFEIELGRPGPFTTIPAAFR